MNKIILSKNKYTHTSFGNTNKHSEINYKLFTNKIKLKQKKYINALIIFVNIFNTFITKKFNSEKELWLIVNDNQTTNLNLLDAKDKIIDFNLIVKELEYKLKMLETLMQPITGTNINYASIRFEGGQKRNKDKGFISAGNLNWNMLADKKSSNPLVYIQDKQIELKYRFTGRVVNAYYKRDKYQDYNFSQLDNSTLVHCILSI